MRLRRTLATGFAVFCLGTTVAASRDSDPAVDRALTQVRSEALRAHMAFLADDLLEGRGTGTRGYELAAKYAAAYFEALGLEPAGVNGSYFQPVPLRKTEAVAERCSLVLRQGDREQKLSYGEGFLTGGDLLREDTSVTAPVVFAGFGVSAPELNYDDYASVDAKGKIVVVLAGAPPSFPSGQRAHYSSGSVKHRTAVAHGAVGFLALWTPTLEKMLPWPVLRRLVRRGSMQWLEAGGVPHDVQPEIRGAAALSQAGGQLLLAGAPASLEEIYAAAEKGKPPAFDLPTEASLKLVSRHTPLASPNVVAVLRGSDPELRNEYVVYTAHLDHEGFGEPVEGDNIYNGAYDNAAGSAVLLEIARAFASLPEPPRRSVVFVLTAAEEEGLLGADYFVHNSPVPAENIVANVNIDGALMLFRFTDVVAYGADHSSLGAVARQATARLGLEVSPDPFPEQTLFIRSDQYPFIKKGVPALFIITGLKSSDPQVNGGALLQQWLTTLYHTPKDDMSQTMDFDTGALYVKLNFLVGYQVANETERPQWNPGDFFGETFGRPRAGAR